MVGPPQVVGAATSLEAPEAIDSAEEPMAAAGVVPEPGLDHLRERGRGPDQRARAGPFIA